MGGVAAQAWKSLLEFLFKVLCCVDWPLTDSVKHNEYRSSAEKFLRGYKKIFLRDKIYECTIKPSESNSERSRGGGWLRPASVRPVFFVRKIMSARFLHILNWVFQSKRFTPMKPKFANAAFILIISMYSCNSNTAASEKNEDTTVQAAPTTSQNRWKNGRFLMI